VSRSVLLFGLMLLIVPQAQAKNLSSPEISGHLYNYTQFPNDALRLKITAYCLNRFSKKIADQCEMKTALIPISSSGDFTVPEFNLPLKKSESQGKYKLQFSIDMQLPDGQFIFTQVPGRSYGADLSIEHAKAVLKRFSLYEIKGKDINFNMMNGQPVEEWIQNNTPDKQMRLLLRVLHADLLAFTPRVYGPVYAYMRSVKAAKVAIPTFYLALAGKHGFLPIVNFEFIINARGGQGPDDYFRLIEATALAPDMLQALSPITLNSTSHCLVPNCARPN